LPSILRGTLEYGDTKREAQVRAVKRRHCVLRAKDMEVALPQRRTLSKAL